MLVHAEIICIFQPVILTYLSTANLLIYLWKYAYCMCMEYVSKYIIFLHKETSKLLDHIHFHQQNICKFYKWEISLQCH